MERQKAPLERRPTCRSLCLRLDPGYCLPTVLWRYGDVPALRSRDQSLLQTSNQPLLGRATLLRSHRRIRSQSERGPTDVQTVKKMRCAPH